MKNANKSAEDSEDLRTVAGKTFVRRGDEWVDTTISTEETKLKIKYLSNAYFDLLKANPGLQQIFALGEHVRVKLSAGVLEIGPDGKESIDSADLTAWSK